MDISKMTVVELKALAYDILAQTQNLQAQLQTVNQVIAEKSKVVPVEDKAEEIKE